MTEKIFQKLPNSSVDSIRELSSPESYKKPFRTVYCGQIPNFSFYLFSGRVKLISKEQTLTIDQPGLFCFSNLVENTESPFTIEIQESSSICTLDRQQLEAIGSLQLS